VAAVSGEGAQPSRRLLGEPLHQFGGRRDVFGKRRRLAAQQDRPVSVARLSKRPGQAQLRRDRQRLEPGRDQILDEPVPHVTRRPAADQVGHERARIIRLGESGAMRVEHVGFLAAHEGGAQLHGAGAEHKRRRGGAAVGRR